MLRMTTGLSEGDLERRLLRKGVVARDLGGIVCAECGRHPLIGETVHAYERDTVCSLCRPRRRRPPLSSTIVRHQEHGLSVRRIAA
jgi:hypothetical protein